MLTVVQIVLLSFNGQK